MHRIGMRWFQELLKRRRRRVPEALVFLLAVIPAAAYAGCEAPSVSSPDAKVVSERNPRIEWGAVPGATGYRMRLLSRVPDGRILAAHDTVLSVPGFLAPRPLADLRAKVTVRIHSVCGAQISKEAVTAFAIDTSATCVIGEISAVAAVGKAELTWRPVGSATTYQIRIFSLDGKLLSSNDTRTPQAQVDLRGRDAVVSVRPVCAGGLGDAAYRTLAAD